MEAVLKAKNCITQIRYDVSHNHIPHSAILELTRKCNLNCIHCYAVPERGRKELTVEELKKVIDDLRELGTLFTMFLGGDPTVSPAFLDILRHTSDRKICIQMYTNALLISDKIADELAKLKIFYIGVSMYGATARTHNTITRMPGSFERTVRAALRLKERGIYVVFKYILMNLNAHEWKAMRTFAEEVGIPSKFDTHITARDNLSLDSQALIAPYEVRKEVHKLQQEWSFKEKTPCEDLGDLACGMGRDLVSVNAYGDVFPCVNVPISAGNVRYASLKEIWHHAPLLKEVRKFPRLDRMHGCPECQVRRYCDRCPGNAFTETGDLYGPQPSACEQALVWKEIMEEKQGKPPTPVEPPPGLKNRKLLQQEPFHFDRFSYFRKQEVPSLTGWEPYEVVHQSGCEHAIACGQARK